MDSFRTSTTLAGSTVWISRVPLARSTEAQRYDVRPLHPPHAQDQALVIGGILRRSALCPRGSEPDDWSEPRLLEKDEAQNYGAFD